MFEISDALLCLCVPCKDLLLLHDVKFEKALHDDMEGFLELRVVSTVSLRLFDHGIIFQGSTGVLLEILTVFLKVLLDALSKRGCILGRIVFLWGNLLHYNFKNGS